ncbi:MAG: IclR family transcriptional regulator [Arenicellales bacterium]
MNKRHRGVRSVEVSVSILSALARHDGPMSLNEIARELNMPPAKAHRYLASFIETGMVHHRRSGSYDLGPLAAEIGLAAMTRAELINRVAEDLEDLVERTGRAAQLSVWGSHGPTIIRWERSAHALITNLGLGSTLPLLSSATGRVFLAFTSPRVTRVLLEEERRRGPSPPDDDQITALIAEVRAKGVAVADQSFIPGLFALAAPILNWQREAEAVVTLASSEPWTEETRTALASFAARHSV